MTIQNRTIHKTYQDKIENGRLVEIHTQKGKTEVYLSTIYPHSFKGWHRHSELTQRFTCIKGSVVVILIDKNNVRQEIALLATNPQTITIEKGITIGIRCTSEDEAYLICVPEPPYDPEDKNERIIVTHPQDF